MVGTLPLLKDVAIHTDFHHRLPVGDGGQQYFPTLHLISAWRRATVVIDAIVSRGCVHDFPRVSLLGCNGANLRPKDIDFCRRRDRAFKYWLSEAICHHRATPLRMLRT